MMSLQRLPLRLALACATFLTLLSLMGVAVCGQGGGESCTVTGDGFTRSDPCQIACFNYEGTCPDGAATVPNQCVYGECADDPESCEAGQVCVQANVDRSYCVDASLCAGS